MRLFSLSPLFALLFAAAAACGGAASSGDLGAPDGGSPEGGPGSGAEGGVVVDGGADAKGLGDAAASADGGMQDTRIDPIEIGRAWTYNVAVIGLFPTCTNGVFDAKAILQETVDGKNALSVQSFCQNGGVYKYSVDGDRVYTYLDGAWKVSIDSPVLEGHTWSDGFLEYRWESKGSVTTPAGTFKDCWSATTVASYTSYIVLCRGVGPVKWHYEDGLGSGYEAILTAKNF